MLLPTPAPYGSVLGSQGHELKMDQELGSLILKGGPVPLHRWGGIKEIQDADKILCLSLILIITPFTVKAE